MPNTNTVTIEQVNEIYKSAIHNKAILFNKCLVVAVQLPSGFVIVESSACVDPENFDESIGLRICEEKIIDKIWELEGYRLQCRLNE